MDDLKLLLQAIVNISNECIDLDAQKKLDKLYDHIVYGPVLRRKKQVNFGIPVDEISGYVPE